ncbi:DNA-binding transcriptional MerR regulator [Actinoalloteichus hoggarensis]|uniref:Zinc-responsive transcriptional regulator n=1 Tax=Actinoalloteichus hoggarensis TaxID=1470176 RepID=A0A221W547_9PSEU|nr:MerR family transcriptional regulator [Actinoalloteichus hoggarensis]ASO20791.1 zinc-responsive transcriptional regulator [Actinoalloteichus hoggarensis]MBB5920721.1 DNA-binding transcriptional MerR regulator [Actinoalloteichus hoggarensis]
MFTISAFARLTELSPKTLRYYHDRGLLVPAQVAADTGYRTYTLRQVADAVRISVLRRGGMPVSRVREVLDNPDHADALIDEFHEELRRRRKIEDDALTGARRAAFDGEAVTGEIRSMPAQLYAAVTVALPLAGETEPGDDATLRRINEEVDRGADRLRDLLITAGITPTGPWWSNLGVHGDRMAVTVHFPLPNGADPAEVTSLAEDVHHGELPARSEAWVEIPYPESDGDSSVRLALSALVSATDELGADLTALRQTILADATRVEFAVTLETSP